MGNYPHGRLIAVSGRSGRSLGVVVALALALGVLLAAQTSGSDPESHSRDEQPSTPLPAISVRRPATPAPYRVPKDALRVSSSAELASALARRSREDIVLAPGAYDNARPFSNPHGHRLYAARLGRAVLRAGIVLGANQGPDGPVIRGLRFDVAQPAKTLHGAIVHVWGSAKNARVLDTSLDGNGVVDSGLTVRQPEGFVARRIVATGFRSYGVLVDPNESDYRTRSPYSLSDLDVSRVARPVPGSSDGTAEACLWLGSQGTVRRVRVRRCALIGVWTGTANDGSLVEDITVDRTQVGVYLEHFTTRTTFRRLRVGPNVSRGINAEWANPDRGGRPASTENVIRDSYFSTVLVGVYLDEGTTRTSIVRSKFVGQKWAAIGDYRGIDNRYEANDFSRIGPDAVPVSHEHIKRGKEALGRR
jgi:hypothetical protein